VFTKYRCFEPNNKYNFGRSEYSINIKKLKVLDLFYNSYTLDTDIKNANIDHIILTEYNKITDQELNSNLKKLNLLHNWEIKDHNLKGSDLRYLNLYKDITITDNGLRFCKNLTVFNFCNCKWITNEV